MRIFIDLPNDVINELTAVCAQEGISREQAVREAIAEYLARKDVRSRDAFFGYLKGREIDGDRLVRRLRNEWGR